MMSDQPQSTLPHRPLETTTRPARRFIPEVVETTTRTSRVSHPAPEVTTPKRRFIPQPFETTTRSSKQTGDTSQSTPRTDFNRGPAFQRIRSSTDITACEVAADQESEKRGRPTSTPVSAATARRFAPQFLGTEIKSSKARSKSVIENPGLPRPVNLEVIPTPFAPENTPVHSLSPELTLKEARRLGKPLTPRRLSLDTPQRQHSFQVPELETIESSESDLSDGGSTSPSSTSEESINRFKRGPFRKGVDVLAVAAKTAERQLQEQALSAFPNDDRHVQVDHFVDRDGSRQVSEYYRRDSDLELKEMQQYRTKAELSKEKEQLAKEKRRKMLAKRGSSDGPTPWTNPFAPSGPRLHAVHPIPAAEAGHGTELQQMRNSARPPMLGTDLTFVRCRSPSPARFDVTQGSYSVRNAMCYLTEQSDNAKRNGDQDGGLWCPKGMTSSIQASPTPSAAPSVTSVSTATTGLWGGCCTQSSITSPISILPTGLMTPRVEGESSPSHNGSSMKNSQVLMHHLPPSPPASTPGSDIQTLSQKLEIEAAIEAEFDDAFITQVYNYLSLGFGSVARRFDDELAKISHVDVTELRADDNICAPRGYIRLGEDGAEELGATQETCVRWKALKFYIHEWARQQPNMATGLAGSALTARKGSWAF